MREVFLERVCLENPKHLAELRAQRSNMGAAVRAVSELESMNDAPKYGGRGSHFVSPGLAIVLIDSPPETSTSASPTEPIIGGCRRDVLSMNAMVMVGSYRLRTMWVACSVA
jgi:hypothetical protein